jgi:hypothetical protein
MEYIAIVTSIWVECLYNYPHFLIIIRLFSLIHYCSNLGICVTGRNLLQYSLKHNEIHCNKFEIGWCALQYSFILIPLHNDDNRN